MFGEHISREAAIVRATKVLADDFDAYNVKVSLQSIPAADVVERPRWIPVTERLPEDNQRVLAYYGFDRGDGYLGMMFMQVLDYFARDPRPHFQHEGANGMRVTHWMPLPEPPEEEETPSGPYDLLYEEGGPDA